MHIMVKEDLFKRKYFKKTILKIIQCRLVRMTQNDGWKYKNLNKRIKIEISKKV